MPIISINSINRLTVLMQTECSVFCVMCSVWCKSQVLCQSKIQMHFTHERVKQVKVVHLHIMREYGGMEVQFHKFFASAPEGTEWSASSFGRFNPGTGSLGRWMGPRSNRTQHSTVAWMQISRLSACPSACLFLSPDCLRCNAKQFDSKQCSFWFSTYSILNTKILLYIRHSPSFPHPTILPSNVSISRAV